MTDRRATRQTARFPTNRGSEDQDTVSEGSRTKSPRTKPPRTKSIFQANNEDSNTGLSRNSSTETRH